jgi:glycerol-3-phosphate dehydrogenase subunit B
MPAADVVVVGAGLAGLATARELAARGASVIVLAKGHASTHWSAGTLDIAAPSGSLTPREGVTRLAATKGHPYRLLASDVEPALAGLLPVLERRGLRFRGDLDSPIRPAPTGIGATRPVAIVPDGQAAALPAWQPGETLVVCGIAGFKDFWAAAVAASLSRPSSWPGDGPSRVVAATAMLPEVEGRRNLSGLHLARAFDRADWRGRAIDAIRRAIDSRGLRPPARLALPAMLGLRDHAAVLDELVSAIGLPVFELPLVPPSVPGMRLWDVLRDELRGAGVRIQLGEPVSRFEAAGRRVERLATPAAIREYVVRAGAVVLATGGIVGGGIVGHPDGTLEEVVLGLPVQASPRDTWFARDPFDPAGHPVEAAGLATDDELRPRGPTGKAVYRNVRACGSLLGGQRWLREQCGDGVALASARRAAISLERDGFAGTARPSATSDTTSAAVGARGTVTSDRR